MYEEAILYQSSARYVYKGSLKTMINNTPKANCLGRVLFFLIFRDMYKQSRLLQICGVSHISFAEVRNY